jgi:hypothetical protein
MEVVNLTPSVADVIVSEIDPEFPRIGMIAVKQTWRFDAEGQVEVDSDDPFPILTKDEPTEFGMLPRDDLPSLDDFYDVILLGSAYAAPQPEVTHRIVSLSVGEVRRELRVIGDRHWRTQAESSPPEPFSQMPLIYPRAYGGTTEVLIDHESPLLVSDHRNPVGRGFDPVPIAEVLGDSLECPPGFPQVSGPRELPNLEHPQWPVQTWSDAPDPYCWATMPLESAMHAQRSIHIAEEVSSLSDVKVLPSWTHRAHPDWVISPPPVGAAIGLIGLTPSGAVTFALPSTSFVADYVIGDRSGSLPLEPKRLVLLPDEGRFSIVHRARFNMNVSPGDERSFRIRSVQE